MFNLFKIELLRHYKMATGVALLHFGVLYYLYTLGASILRGSQALIWLLFCAALSAGFGIFQMYLHKRDNDWLYLLHRPLPPKKIFFALVSAGSCISLLAGVLPMVLDVIVMHGNGMFGIEARHYQSMVYAAAVSLTAYWCGCFAMLSANRLGFLALSLIAIFPTVAPESELWVSALLLMASGFALAHVAFKPDLSQPPTHLHTLMLTELPIRAGGLVLITITAGLLLWVSDILSGNSRTGSPVPGTDDFVRRMPAKEVMQLALENSTHASARRLAQQVALGETMDVGTASFYRNPRRGQVPFIDEDILMGSGDGTTLWRFHHDVMLFEGRNVDTAAFTGWLGPDGIHDAEDPLPAVHFDSVPWVAQDRYILSDNDIYQIDWEARRVYHRYHDTDADRFNNSLKIGETTTTLYSNNRLYLFDSAAFRDEEAILSPVATLDVLTPDGNDLRRLALLSFKGGYLVSALLDATPFNNAPEFASLGHARLDLYLLPREGGTELIASTPLPSGANEWSLYKELVLGPAVRLLIDLGTGIRDHKSAEITLPLLYVKFPLKILLATAMVCLLSAGITAQLLRGSTLPLRIKLFWIIGNALTGGAGLVSFVGYYWKRRDLLFAGAPLPPHKNTMTQHSPTLGYNN